MLERRNMMKSNTKTAFKLGVLATITVAGTIYYYISKNNKSAGAMLDKSLDSLEEAANEANRAFRDAQAYAQSKARGMFRNVQYHADNIKEGFEDGIEIIDKEITNVAKDIKKNVEKSI
jgi:ABC-type transporter Mla subunit MlaD